MSLGGSAHPNFKFLNFRPMNPFNIHKKYDYGLSSILSRMSKPSLVTKEVLKELIDYLPNVDIDSDTQIILNAIRPLLGTPLRPLINKSLYFLLKRSKMPLSIQVPWIYYNVDSRDPYAGRIFEKYFDVRAVSKEFEDFLKWDDFSRDLQSFLYLIQRSDAEHYFSVESLPLQTHFELDVLFEILSVIKRKDPERFLSAVSQKRVGEGGYARIARETLTKILDVRDPQLLDRKYSILLDIYDLVDDTVFEESRNLDCTVLQKIVDKVDCSRLGASTVSQIATILPRVENPIEFIIANVDEAMCIFDLIRRTGIEKSVVLEKREIFSPMANESLARHYVAKMCMCSPGTRLCSTDPQTLRGIYDLFTGKHRIISSSVLCMRLVPMDFESRDIEETMEYAVDVFPKEFFLSKKFNASAVPFLKKYPSELCCSTEALECLISNFSETKKSDVAKLIDDVPVLMQFLSTFSLEEIKSLYKPTVDSKLKIVYLYYLRLEVEPFDVDYAQVFDHLLSRDFLRFLISSGYSISNFIKTTVEYIRNAELPNTVFYTGFNFDEDPDFYSSLQLPSRDPLLKVLFEVLEIPTLSSSLKILRNLIGIILHKSTCTSKSSIDSADIRDYCDSVRSRFDLGKNNFIVERYIRETSDQEHILYADVLGINRDKARDVALRHFRLGDIFAHGLNPSYLSNPSLSNVVNAIVAKFSSLDSHILDFSFTSPVRVFSRSNDLGYAIQALELDSGQGDKGCTLEKERELSNEEIKTFVSNLFVKKESKSPLDFIYLMENDLILRDGEFRDERIRAYLPLIDIIAKEVSATFINLYSLSKLENGSTDEAVLDFILDQLKDYRNSFWTLLANTLYKTRNIYISMFIEKMVMKWSDGGECDYFRRHRIADPREYISLCSDIELCTFAFVFPLVYSKIGTRRITGLENMIKDLARTEVDNGKLSFSKTNEHYKLRLTYRVDSASHSAVICVPITFPMRKARIEFDHASSKNAKFYYKLNGLLSKTSKFVEILLLWKVDIDNHLAGHTECLICYFIVEPRYRTLPSFKCLNCANCYHEKCIYKWVAESRNKQCPLCRVELQLRPKTEFSK